jgi:type II secretory pathway component PulM
VEFRPARWLVTTLTVLALWLVSPTLGKRGLLAVTWQFAPRQLRLIAGGVAALALVVVAGSVAALALVLNQLA